MAEAALARGGSRVSWEEYAALPADPCVEYVDGRLLVSPSPSRTHQTICRRLANLIEAVLPESWAVTSAWSWKTGADEYIPDVMVHPMTDEQTRFTGTPALCVEVLSTNRGDDLVLKAGRYARAGLVHYWVVDPRDGELSAYTLTDQGVYERDVLLQLDGGAGGRRSARLDAGPVEVVVDLAELLAP